MAPVELTLEKNSDGTLKFHPGDTIKGTVVMTLNEEKKCKALFVMFYGSAHITFFKLLETIKYEEIYLNTKIEIFEHKEAVMMQPGVYNYNISFTLPKKLPRSNSVKFNCSPYPHLDDYCLSYYARANLDFPWSFMRISTAYFCVDRNDNLNDFPQVKIPRVISADHKFLTYESIFSDQISIPFRLVACLPCTGFVPGQTINLKLRFENPTDVKITNIEIVLIETQVKEFQKRKLRKEQNLTLVSKIIEGINAKEFKEVDCEMKIPVNVNQSEILYSTAVNLRHAIKITAKAEGYHFDPSVSIPIIIGSIPLADNERSASEINKKSLALYDGMKK